MEFISIKIEFQRSAASALHRAPRMHVLKCSVMYGFWTKVIISLMEKEQTLLTSLLMSSALHRAFYTEMHSPAESYSSRLSYSKSIYAFWFRDSETFLFSAPVTAWLRASDFISARGSKHHFQLLIRAFVECTWKERSA